MTPHSPRRLVPLLAMVALSACAPTLSTPAISPEMGEWRAYNNMGGNRYSPLAQIDRDNADDLEVAWQWSSAPVLGEENAYRNQSTPLMVDGVLYFTAGEQRQVIAADAATGETKWVWNFNDSNLDVAPRANSGRGVSYWSDGTDARIFVVTPGYYLVALDAETGTPVPSFGDNGVVNLKQVLGAPQDAVIGTSSPPAIYQDVIAVGPALAVGLAPPSRRNVKGTVMAFDTRTGEKAWEFHTIPQAGEFGNDTWENGSAEYTGNAGVWAPIAVDYDRGVMYLPVEDATGDYYGGHRIGDNLFSASLVAVDALTGERIWHFQLVHHDIFDRDPPTAPLLADFTLEETGERVQAVVQLTKQAFAYVFDRVTGEPVWPIVERPVDQTDIVGERTAATQPIPTKPAGYDRQGVTVDDLIDFTPELRAEALEAIEPFRLGKLYTPPSLREAPDGTQGTLSLPGTTGGTNWEGGAIDPETGMLYVGSYTNPSVLALVTDEERSDMDYIFGYGRVPQVQDLPLFKPPYSRITAIDLTTGDHAWMKAAGDTPEEILNNPALAGVTIPPTGTPGSRPVLLVTRTLLFAGEGSGGMPYLHILDKATGEEIQRIELPAPITSNPMSYSVDGRQYVAFWVGGVPENVRSTLVALALP